jgi:hypothetical protein
MYLFNLGLLASNERIIGEHCNEKDVEGGGRGLFQVLSQDFPVGTEENNKQLLSGLPPDYEAGVLPTQPRRSVIQNNFHRNS